MKTSMKEWVDALRSGKFKQGQSVLYNPDQDAYCCLGVLCELEGWSIVPCGDDEGGLGDDEEGYNSGLYNYLREELGRGFVRDVIQMNDDGEDFDTIATYIETVKGI